MRRCLCCLLSLFVVFAVTGCGRPISTLIHNFQLTVYSSSNTNTATGRQIVDGERLELGVAHGLVDVLSVKFVLLSSNRGTSKPPAATVIGFNAQTVLRDNSAIGYLGETQSFATRRSLPILSAASIAVISPNDRDPQLTAKVGTLAGSEFPGGIRTGYSLAVLTDAQVFKLAGPRFRKLYHRAYGGRPTAAVARGYMAMNILLQAINAAGANGHERGGRDRRGVALALGPVMARVIAAAQR